MLRRPAQPFSDTFDTFDIFDIFCRSTIYFLRLNFLTGRRTILRHQAFHLQISVALDKRLLELADYSNRLNDSDL